MGTGGDTRQKAALTDYLAAERTLLAWIRTGLALMGFGFVVARFGLFLRQLQAMQHGAETQSYGLSLWFGTALIAAGIGVNVFPVCTTSGWCGSWNVAKPDTVAHPRRRWQLHSFWRWSGWQWRSI